MRNTLLLLAVAGAMIASSGCQIRFGLPPQSPNDRDMPKRMRELDSAADDEINPWLVQPKPQLTLITTQTLDADELPVSEEQVNNLPEIQFTAAPVEPEQVPAPQPDTKPDALSAGFVSDQQVDANVRDSQYAGVLEAIASLDAKLDNQSTTLDAISAKIVDADQMRSIVADELEKFGGKLRLEYKLTATGETKTTDVPITTAGTGSVALPPGAVVTAIGGVPVAQSRAENPDAVVLDGSVKSGGSVATTMPKSGGSNGSVTTSIPQYISPITSTYYESTIPIDQQPVVVPTEFYSSPGQFSSSVSSYPDSTQVQFEVDPVYMPDSSQCYTDSAGNRVCPTQVTPTQSSGGLFNRLRARRGR